jgi:DNA repair exonuclease SbcCD nuclease subunit
MSRLHNNFSFLQVSDVYVDCQFPQTRLPIPPELRQERNREILATLVHVFELARERAVNAVLIPGGLLDSEHVTAQIIATIIEACASLKDTPVLIAPGYSDFYSSQSPYNSRVLAFRGLSAWPANVHIFTESEFTTFTHPESPEICFTGRAFTSAAKKYERLLNDLSPKHLLSASEASAPINILLLHAALDDYSNMASFSAQQLDTHNFTYAALGYSNELKEVRSKDNRLLGAYSGCLAGRSFDDIGPKYVLLGTIENGETKLEAVESGGRRMVAVTVDVTDLSAKAVLGKIAREIDTCEARADYDHLHISLNGIYHRGQSREDQRVFAHKVKDVYQQAVIVDNTCPSTSLEHLDPRTTEYKFIQQMLTMESADHDSNPAIIEDALVYGLDALRHKKVTVRNVD